MKRIGILSILILCLVVGGVYATWDYAHGQAELQQQTNIAVNLTASNIKAHKGNIVGRGNSTISLYIDDVSPKDLHPDDVSGEGSLVLDFKAADTAPQTVKDNGIIMQYCVEPNFDISQFMYDNKQVYTAVDSTWKELTGGVASLEATLNGADIAACITVNKEIHLDTLEKYNAFNTAVGAKTFKVSIREKPAEG